jgi:hypothetical protein
VLAREAPDVAPDELRELADLLEQYLNSLPGAVAALTAMAKEPQVGRSVAFAAGQVLLYVADEDDFLSEGEAGAVGLLDDLSATEDGTQPPPLRAEAAVNALRDAF